MANPPSDLCLMDMARLELHLAGTPEVMVHHGFDAHTRRAAAHFKVKPEDVTVEQRRVGKQLNYMADWIA